MNAPRQIKNPGPSDILAASLAGAIVTLIVTLVVLGYFTDGFATKAPNIDLLNEIHLASPINETPTPVDPLKREREIAEATKWADDHRAAVWTATANAPTPTWTPGPYDTPITTNTPVTYCEERLKSGTPGPCAWIDPTNTPAPTFTPNYCVVPEAGENCVMDFTKLKITPTPATPGPRAGTPDHDGRPLTTPDPGGGGSIRGS